MSCAKTICYNENTFTSEEIYGNDELYCFLLSYYYTDLQEPDIDAAIRSSSDMRRTICEYMAAWLPWEKHYPEIKDFFARL